MASFKTDDTFNRSYKMGIIKSSEEKLKNMCGERSTVSCENICDMYWDGCFTSNDGSEHRASIWDWKGSLTDCGQVSIWIDEPMYLLEFMQFLEA